MVGKDGGLRLGKDDVILDETWTDGMECGRENAGTQRFASYKLGGAASGMAAAETAVGAVGCGLFKLQYAGMENGPDRRRQSAGRHQADG